MALQYGIDPIKYLSLEVDDIRVINEVLKQRDKFEAERMTALVESVASQTANLTAHAITGWLAKNPIRVWWKEGR